MTQAKLAEMMANADWRDGQRTARVGKYREEQAKEDEEAKREHDPGFLNRSTPPFLSGWIYSHNFKLVMKLQPSVQGAEESTREPDDRGQDHLQQAQHTEGGGRHGQELR